MCVEYNIFTINMHILNAKRQLLVRNSVFIAILRCKKTRLSTGMIIKCLDTVSADVQLLDLVFEKDYKWPFAVTCDISAHVSSYILLHIFLSYRSDRPSNDAKALRFPPKISCEFNDVAKVLINQYYCARAHPPNEFIITSRWSL